MDIFSKNSIDIFKDVTNSEFEDIKKLFHYKKYKKGDFIIKEDELVTNVYFIVSGLVKLFYSDRLAKEFILSFAFENWWETDFYAFYNQSKAILNLQCIEDTTVYCLHYNDYLWMLDTYPQLANYFLNKSINGHIANQKRILSLLGQSPKLKYEQFLHTYPQLVQRIPKSILSLYLGVSRETLSRLYKNGNKK
ncbi:Crp/Fnr family transcriptional regulator [Flavobacterium sp. PS2]|uniref:Crp/Fnr family transcriptional regulator n=1 Tax=Flavobacterium sp. PS2 TaxID=3384157 RepID=UPI00390C86E0